MTAAPNQPGPPRLRHQRVAFTGRMATLSRREAEEAVREHGGQVVETVGRRTSMLVVGMAGWALSGDGSLSRKLAQAEALQAAGVKLDILSELAFRERIGLERPSAAEDREAGKSLTREQVSASLQVSPETLRRWEMLSLVRSRDGLFDFQDLVSLRTIAELVTSGVRPETIARSLHGLASVVPDAERPLAQLRIVQDHGGALLAELGEALVDPRGQLLLNFDATPRSSEPSDGLPPGAPSRILSLRGAFGDVRPDSPEAWFQRAAELERDDRFDDAAAAYRAALALRDPFPEAHFNLGNVYREAGRRADAATAYRKAAEQDSSLAQAWYNLADLEEETGQLASAADCLRRALAADPGFADAHFNLAHVYERLSRPLDAARHWSAYLRLDREGPWADQARVRLAVCRAG